RGLIRCPRSLQGHFFFSFTPSNDAASARKRRSSPSVGWFFSIHGTALSYQERACSLSPSCQWAMARKNQSFPSPPSLSSFDFVRASIAAFQSPLRYCATPRVFQWPRSLGASCTAFLASATARLGSRREASREVANSQARLLFAMG